MDPTGAPRILVLGVGKSGTSALHYCIKRSAEIHFGVPFPSLFEPRSQAAVQQFTVPFGVAKILVERLWLFDDPHGVLPGFDKTVFIVRDPRDSVISRLLWQVATRIHRLPATQGQCIEAAFERKQRDPESISVFELCRMAGVLTEAGDEYPAACRRLAYDALQVLRSYEGLFPTRYEDFVDWNVQALQSYLGFALTRDGEVPGKAGRVRRTARYRNWEHWFLAEDFEFFVEPERDKLEALGYADERPTGHRRIISPDESTEYIRRIRAPASA